MMRGDLLSYAARAGCACGVAAVLPLLCAAFPRLDDVFALPLFCPLAACVTVAPRTLGAALKTGTHVVCGICAGGLLAAAALAAAEALRERSEDFNSDAATYVMLVVLALPILCPAFAPLAAKFALNNVIISLFTWRAYGGGALLPLRLALTTVSGVAVALAVCAAPWPRARACAEMRAHLSAAEKLSASLCALLARGFGRDEQAFRYTAALAESHRAAAAALEAALGALEEPVAWEVWAFAAPVPQYGSRLAVLRETLVACDGATLALADARVAEATHARAVGRARLSSLSSTGDLDRIDELLAGPLRDLSDAVDAALRSASAAYDGELGSAAPLDKAEAVLKAADSSFDAALLEARVQVYYGPRPPDLVAAGVTATGAPIEHYTVFYAWQWLIQCALRALDGSRAHVSEKRALGTARSVDSVTLLRRFFAPYLQPLDRVRMLYASKLIASVVAAAWLGNLTCGSGLWAAITAQIVGGRDNLYSGGSFRVATSRLTGTVLGALWGYALLTILGEAPFGVVLPLLAAWSAVFALVRASPRTAYMGLVVQFTPLIITLDATRTSDTRLFAYRRIEQNLIGILAFVAIEFLVVPRRASSLLLGASADVLRGTAAVVAAAWQPVLLGARCAACAAGDATATADVQAALAAKLAHAKTLLNEAGDEPALLRPAALLPPLQAILSSYDGALGSVLSLLQTAAAASAVHGTPTLHDDIRQDASCLRAALRELFCALAADLDAGACSGGAISASVAVTQSMAAFEARYADALGRHRDAHRGLAVPIVPTSTVLPLDALIYATRQLIRLTGGVEASVRVALRTEGGGELVGQTAPAPRRLSSSSEQRGTSADAQCACGAPL